MANFETPDPGIIDRPYVEQIPLQALFQNMGYKQSRYDADYQQLQSTEGAFDNMHAYGQDAIALQKIKDQFNQGISEINKNGGSLSDANTKAKIDGLVASTTKAITESNILQRSYTKDQVDAERKDAILKGKNYYNWADDDISSYYNSGVFDSTKQFNSRGGIAPDMEKTMKAVKDNTEFTQKNVYDPITQTYTPVKVYEPKYLKETANGVLSGPEWKDYEDYLFHKTTASMTDEDWAKKANNDYKPLYMHATAAQGIASGKYQEALKNGDTKAAQSALLAYSDATNTLHDMSAYASSPTASYAAKLQAREDHHNQLVGHITKGLTATQEQKIDMDKYHEILQSNAAEKARAEEVALVTAAAKQSADAGTLEVKSGKVILPDGTIPGNAEIAGESALRKKTLKDGTGAFISSNMDDFHKYANDSKNGVSNPNFATDPDGSVRTVNLTSGIMEKLGIKDPKYGEGWRQINNESFLKNWKKNNGIETTANAVTLSHKDGAPEIYVKGDRIIVGIRESATETSYRDINANNLFAAEYNQAGTKNAPLLMHSKEANISGNYEEPKPTTVPTTVLPKEGDTKTFKEGKGIFKNGKWELIK